MVDSGISGFPACDGRDLSCAGKSSEKNIQKSIRIKKWELRVLISEKRYEVPFLMLKNGIFLCNGMKKNKTLQKNCSVIQYYYAQYT